jgi:hypothetical protein
VSAAGPWAAEAGPVPQVAFAVQDAARLEHAAVPTLRFELRADSGGAAVRSILLDTQIRIAARRRHYDAAATDRLFELFGPREDWAKNLNSLLWTRITTVVPPFTASTTIDVLVPCSYDLEVAASRYLDALADGEVPLEFLFSGALFYAGADGRLQTARISWEAEAEYRLPVAVWKETMERHFPGSAWLRVDKATFDRLCTYRSMRALPTWAGVFDELLPAVPAGEEDGS